MNLIDSDKSAINLIPLIKFNTLVQFAGKGVFALLAFFLVSFLARTLGAEGFGVCTSLFAWITTLIVVADMGLYLTGLRRLSVLSDSHPKLSVDLLGDILAARLIIAVVIVFSAFCILMLLPYHPETTWLIALSLPAVIMISAARTYKSRFQAELIMQYSVTGEIAGCLTMVIVTVSMIYFNVGLNLIVSGTKTSAIAVGLIAGCSVLMISHVFFTAKDRKLGFRFNIEKIKELITESYPLGISAILAILYFRFDMLMLSWMKPAQDVGIYGVAYTVVEVAAVAPALFLGSMLPVFSRCLRLKKSSDTRQALIQYYQKSLKFLAMLAIPGLIIGVLFAKPLMVAIAGARFFQMADIVPGLPWGTASGSFFVFQLLVGVAFLMVWGQLNGHILVAGGKQKKILKIYFFLVPFNVILNFMLIPSYSYNGAAMATLISEAMALVITSSLVKKEFNLFPFTVYRDHT